MKLADKFLIFLTTEGLDQRTADRLAKDFARRVERIQRTEKRKDTPVTIEDTFKVDGHLTIFIKPGHSRTAEQILANYVKRVKYKDDHWLIREKAGTRSSKGKAYSAYRVVPSAVKNANGKGVKVKKTKKENDLAFLKGMSREDQLNLLKKMQDLL